MEDKFVIVLGAAKNKLAKIEYTTTNSKGEVESKCYIGELDYLRDGYIGIELPYNAEKGEMRCGGLGTTADSVVITPITDEDRNMWLEHAIEFIEFGRKYDKWDRSLSFSGDEYMEECKYVDGHADGRLRRVKALELYCGEKLEVNKN